MKALVCDGCDAIITEGIDGRKAPVILHHEYPDNKRWLMKELHFHNWACVVEWARVKRNDAAEQERGG